MGDRDKTGRNSTLGYAAKLNFELDHSTGVKVWHAAFRGLSAMRIGTNLIYSESSGSAGRHREICFSKFPLLMKLLAVKRVKGVANSKTFFSVKNTTHGRTDPAAPGLSASD